MLVRPQNSLVRNYVCRLTVVSNGSETGFPRLEVVSPFSHLRENDETGGPLHALATSGVG